MTFSRARTETQIYAVCREDGHFTSLTYTRMLGNTLDEPEFPPKELPQRTESDHSSDSDRDDPFGGTGADWVNHVLESTSISQRKTKRLGDEV